MISLAAHAANDVIFSCNVEGGKQAKIIKSGSIYTYSFGAVGALELVFQNTEKQILFRSYGYDGVGRNMSNELKMKNRSYKYSVISYVDRMSESQRPQGQVSVYKGNKLLAEMECISEPDGSL